MKAYFCVVIALFLTSTAQAELLKCVDAAGRVTYGEKALAGQQCSAVTAPVNVIPATKVPAPAPASAGPQPVSRRADLERQIANLEGQLAEAQKALTEQQNIRLGSEANYQRVLDRLQPYEDKVAEIQKNLDQLRSELARTP